MKKILLRMENVTTESKQRNGLDKMSFILAQKEILGVLALNQNGISDLIDLFESHKKVKSGQLYFEEKRVDTYDNSEIIVINRYARIIEGLSLAENVFLMRKNDRTKIIKKRIIEKETERLLSKFGISWKSGVDASILSTFERYLLQIIKAVVNNCKVIVFENIGVTLSQHDLRKLSEVINELREKGMSFIYISNYPDDFFKWCNRGLIYENGKVTKKLYNSKDVSNYIALYGSLSRYNRYEENNVNVVKNKEEFIIEKLLQKDIKPGELVTIWDRNCNKLQDVLKSVYHEKFVSDIEVIEIVNKKTIYLIPEFPIENTIFRDCSYMFNLCFYLEKKLKRSFISHRFYKSIMRELAHDIGEKLKATSLEYLNNYELLELIYHRAMMHKPDVVLIYQPFIDCDMEMQPYVENLILKLKKRNIAVIVLASYIANLALLSEKTIEL